MWSHLEVLPDKYVLEEKQEIQECLGDSGLKYWYIYQDFIFAGLSLLGIGFCPKIFLVLVGILPNNMVWLEMDQGWWTAVLEILEELELRSS